MSGMVYRTEWVGDSTEALEVNREDMGGGSINVGWGAGIYQGMGCGMPRFPLYVWGYSVWRGSYQFASA